MPTIFQTHWCTPGEFIVKEDKRKLPKAIVPKCIKAPGYHREFTKTQQGILTFQEKQQYRTSVDHYVNYKARLVHSFNFTSYYIHFYIIISLQSLFSVFAVIRSNCAKINAELEMRMAMSNLFSVFERVVQCPKDTHIST